MTIRCKRYFLFLLLISAEAIFVSEDLLAGNNKARPDVSENQGGRRRRKPGGGGSLFEELEFFKHNGDVFVGPSYHMGSGNFFDLSLEKIKERQGNFAITDGEMTTNYISVVGGVQYRYLPFPKAKDISSLISFAIGQSYQSRGYSYRYEKKSANQSDSLVNNLLVTEKVRAGYLTIPVSARFGGRFFIEAGLSLNIMIHGTSQFQSERSAAWGGLPKNNPGIIDYYSIYTKTYKLGNILPFVSPGFTVSGGMYFSENLGLRFCANLAGKYFKANTNPDDSNFTSTILSVQLLGTVN